MAGPIYNWFRARPTEARYQLSKADNVSPHWRRHSHASHALERGASVTLVRDTLGHSSLAITSLYTHAKPSESSALHLAVQP
jgi:integrase/recombinase XerD